MLKLYNHNIILPKYLKIVKKKGSSFAFSASGGWDKEKKGKAAEKFLRSPSEGEAEGGCGGNSASPERQSSQSGFSSKKVRISSKRYLPPFREGGGRICIFSYIRTSSSFAAYLLKEFLFT